MEDFIEKSFAGLTSAFDTTFEMETDKNIKALVSQAEQQIGLIEEKKSELVNTSKQEVMLKDQSFLDEEIKSLIISSKTILAKLEAEIKIGSKSSYFDSYSKLASTVVGELKELRELNMAIVQAAKDKNSNNDVNNKRVSIVLDANALMELVNKAQQNSQMKAIDASFKVEEGED